MTLTEFHLDRDDKILAAARRIIENEGLSALTRDKVANEAGLSALAVPIRDGTGQLRGVLAARGVPGGGSSMAALRDLTVIADWASPALCDAPAAAAAHDPAPPPYDLEDGDRRRPDAGSDGTGEADEREPAPLTI